VASGDDPTVRATAPDGAPAPPGASPSGRPSTGWWAGAAALAILTLVVGYAVGNSRGKSSERDNYEAGAPGYQAIYDQGSAAGRREGVAVGKRQGARVGAQAGEVAGRRAGFEKGEAAGEARGTQEGASAALGNLTDWDTDDHYIIRVAEGASPDVPYTIATRTAMKAGDAYALCESDPTVVCVDPAG
jgi:hypothetical protein